MNIYKYFHIEKLSENQGPPRSNNMQDVSS